MLKSKIDLFGQSWIDTVFEGKNKKYGAYYLRSRESKATIRAAIIGAVIFVSLIGLPVMLKTFEGMIKPKNKPIEDTATLVELPPVEDTKDLNEIVPPKEQIKSVQDIQRFVRLAVSSAENADAEDPASQADLINKLIGKTTEVGDPTGQLIIDAPPENTGNEARKVTDDPTVYTQGQLEVDAEPVGGKDAFYKFIGDNLKIDDLDLGGNTLRIMLRFVIEKSGNLTNVTVESDGGYPEAALRAVNLLKSGRGPKWRAGVVQGMPVRTSYKLPITMDLR